jgi:hypothetical protein
MEPFYTIFGKSEYAEVNADYAAVDRLLLDDSRWGANVLEMSGDYNWRVKLARLESWGWFSSRVFPQSDNQFIAFGVTGKRSFLGYQILKKGDNKIRITPVGYLPKRSKVVMVIALALLYILPVLLSPFIFKLYEIVILRSSKIYLDAFCRYLYDRLVF